MFDLPKYGDGICLARMAELLDALAIDRACLQQRSIAITGSNGKGSTAAFCASIGRAYGLRTGLFTSPHLFRVNERFQIDGVPIADADLCELVVKVARTVDAVSQRCGERFGAFEAMFALACLYCQENDCDLLVFEAGIGGRYDPVRLLGSDVTAVTSVDFEHVELLGHSLQLIVSDKSDACACGGMIIYGENCRPLRQHIAEYNYNRNVEGLFVRDEIRIKGESIAAVGQDFDFAFGDHEFRSLNIALSGGFQLNNAAIATALFLCWLERRRAFETGAHIETAVRSGLRKARWPGRLEAIAQDPLVVIGVSFDKKEIADALAPAFDNVICTAAHHKGLEAAALAAIMSKRNPQADFAIAATIEQAFAMSRARAASLHRRIYVAGGLFTAVEFAAVARGIDAKDLAFF
jgi:dihydrofolate synthase/folylpolyglutamate synthase